MILGKLRIQFKRENIYFRIKGSSIFLVHSNSELEPCLAISHEIATQSSQELNLKTLINNTRPIVYDVAQKFSQISNPVLVSPPPHTPLPPSLNSQACTAPPMIFRPRCHSHIQTAYRRETDFHAKCAVSCFQQNSLWSKFNILHFRKQYFLILIPHKEPKSFISTFSRWSAHLH